MTTNDLETKLEQIKACPHGFVARDASHWLAVNVMVAELTFLKDGCGSVDGKGGGDGEAI